MKFPMKTGDLSRRWCSAYLKIMVADTVMINLSRLGELEELGGKCHKFPAKGGIINGRWCSAELKREVADSVIRNLDALEVIAGSGINFRLREAPIRDDGAVGTLRLRYRIA